MKLSLTNGAKVVVVDLDTSKADKELANEISNGQVICVQADTTKEADVERYNKVTLDKFGQVDGVALNAGAGHPAQAWTETDVSVMDKMYEVNIKGTWLGEIYPLPFSPWLSLRRQACGTSYASFAS